MFARHYLSVIIFCLGIATPPQVFAQESDHAVVIVHGAWGGSHHWKSVAEKLAETHSGTIRRVSLTGLGERVHLASPDVDLQTHIRDVTNVIEFDDLQSVILIGHSYGGVVASGVVDAIPERISKVMYLDAHLLNDGEAYLTNHPNDLARLTQRAQEAGDGYLIPVDWKNNVCDVPHPLATLTQPLRLTNQAREEVPSTYWLFADGKPAEDDERFDYFQRAKSRGWPVSVFSWGHNPHRGRPGELAAALLAAF